MKNNTLVALIIVLLFVDCRSDDIAKAVRYQTCVAHHPPEKCK